MLICGGAIEASEGLMGDSGVTGSIEELEGRGTLVSGLGVINESDGAGSRGETEGSGPTEVVGSVAASIG